MGRLIDADVVEDTLKKCVSNAYKRRDVQCATGVSLAILQLRNIPTAYDMEKVVAELLHIKKDMSQGCEDISNNVCMQYDNCAFCVLARATDIVKMGGVE